MARIRQKLEAYRRAFESNEFSATRFSHLRRTVSLLMGFGRTVLVRLPVDAPMEALQRDYMPGFDVSMSTLARELGATFEDQKCKGRNLIFPRFHGQPSWRKHGNIRPVLSPVSRSIRLGESRTPADYRAAFARHGMFASMSRKSDCLGASTVAAPGRLSDKTEATTSQSLARTSSRARAAKCRRMATLARGVKIKGRMRLGQLRLGARITRWPAAPVTI